MVDEANHEPAEEEQPAQANKKASKFARLLNPLFPRTLLAALLVVSIVGHVVGYVSHRLTVASGMGATGPEISLGQFTFQADPSLCGKVAKADFQLHVSLLANIDGEARARLSAHQYRVRQSVEELLRGAHGGDFEDPDLCELKRRLQEQINKTMGIRAIADVIVTDLQLTSCTQDTEPIAKGADELPWVDGSSG